MSDPASPKFVVRRLDPGDERRRRLLFALAFLAMLLLGIGLGLAFAERGRVARSTVHVPSVAPVDAPVSHDAEELAQQVANLKRSEQMARIAADSLRHTLADREEEISALRADLAFYSRLVGSGEQQSGPVLHRVLVAPIAGSRASNISLTLTQSANRGAENHGKVTLAVEGVQDGDLVWLAGEDLGDPEHHGELSYRFRYFEQLHATVMLPENFIPNRLRVTVKPDGGNDVQRDITWTDALKPVEETDVQQ